MKKFLFTLTVLFGSLTFATAQHDIPTFEEINQQLMNNDSADLFIEQIAIMLWPAEHIGEPPAEDEKIYTFIVRIVPTEGDQSIPYTTLQVYDKEGNHLGESFQSYGSFYGTQKTETFTVALKNNLEVTELQLFLLSGFGNGAAAYEIDLPDF